MISKIKHLVKTMRTYNFSDRAFYLVPTVYTPSLNYVINLLSSYLIMFLEGGAKYY